MKVIKVSNPWGDEFYQLNINRKSICNNYKFEINNNCNECDYWIIWEGVKAKEKVFCPTTNIMFLPGETNPGHIYKQKFINQFSKVITCRNDIKHAHILKANHDLGSGAWHFRNRTYEEVVSLEKLEKKKELSVVASNLTVLEGHKKRFAFVNRMIGHFKDKMDVFGRGFNFIEDKYNGIADYKYSIAIENSVIPGYFTEKLYECFLTYTMPIYYGCPNITDFFDTKSMVIIDIDDYKKSISMIEEAIETNLYERSLEYIIDSRNKFLNHYHIYLKLTLLINSCENLFSERKQANIIYPQKYFSSFPEKISKLSSRTIKFLKR